jgi:hypothetical protein
MDIPATDATSPGTWSIFWVVGTSEACSYAPDTPEEEV